jgi:hypothetical protein
MPTTTIRRFHLLLLALLLVAGAVLRLAYLAEPSLWWDEFITLGISQLSVGRMLHILTVIGPSDIGGEFFPPLYHLITHFVLRLSHDDAVLRLLSVASGTASIAVLYVLVGELLSRRAGLFAAALTTFSVYQLHYSRELRPYSLFMLLALLSLFALYRALTRGGPVRYVLYALVTTAMCYTSYMATSNIAAEGLFTAWFLGSRLATWQMTRKAALLKGLALLAAVAVVGLCYAPWLPAYHNIFNLLRSKGVSPGIPDDFLLTVATEFGAYAAQRHGLPWLPLLLLGLAGCAIALQPRYRDGLVLLGAFALMPVIAFLVADTQLEISSRYVFNAYYWLMAMAGLALAVLLERVAAHLEVPEKNAVWSVPVAGVLLCLCVNIPNLRSLGTYYRRETSYSKELADYLAWNKNDVRYLFYQSNRNPKLIADWYLPHVFENLSTYTPQGYKRTFHLIQSDLTPPQTPFFPKKLVTIQDATVSAIGLVSTAPVVLFPDSDGKARYTDDFTTYRFYADCDEAVNLGPESRYHTLSHYDYEKPGHVAYTFQAAAGTRITQARAALTFSATFLEGIASDSRITVSLAAGDAPLRQVGVVTGKDFIGPDGKLIAPNHEKRRFVTKTYAVPDIAPDAAKVRLRLDYGPVANPGVIEAFRVELHAAMSGRPTGPAPALDALLRAAQNNALATWQPGEPLVDADALYVFPTAQDIPQGPANAYAALAPFRAAHPGLAPVCSIPGENGAPAYLFYDPVLTDPFMDLAQGAAVTARLGHTPPREFPAIKLRGALNRPKLRIDDKTLSVPVLAPPPSTLLLGRAGVGVLRFEPSFSTERQALDAFPLAWNIRKNDGEDCLSCKSPGPCSVTVPISSAYPVKTLRILSYPRVFADKAGQNTVTISFSEDGTHFKRLDALTSDRSGLWQGLMVRRVSVLRFARPIHNAFVRFDFSGPGAQLWSRDATRMRIEAVLDASAFAGLRVGKAAFPIRLEENGGAPLSLFLSPWPQPYLPGLQDDF